MRRSISITVNGTRQTRAVEPSLLLVEFIRETTVYARQARERARSGRGAWR